MIADTSYRYTNPNTIGYCVETSDTVLMLFGSINHFTMNNAETTNDHLRRRGSIDTTELSMARTWIDRKVAILSSQLYESQEGQWSNEERLFYLMIKGHTLRDPNRKKTVDLDRNLSFDRQVFEATMGMVQLYDILGTNKTNQTYEARKEMARTELIAGNWGNVFMALSFDGLIGGSHEEASIFFMEWAAQNHLHLPWRMIQTPQRILEEAMNEPGSPYSKEVATMLSYIPEYLQRGNRFWMTRQIKRALSKEFQIFIDTDTREDTRTSDNK
jgi:hypothetical protein